jgi:hypothetical protein
MERSDRVRIVAVSALAVLVMGGVVAWGVLGQPARARSAQEPPEASGPPSAERPPPHDPRAEEPLPDECEPKEGEAPKVAFDAPGDRVDFGPLRQGVTVEKEVVVRNAGTGLLCVRDTETGCGCVKAQWLGSNRVPPGGEGRLKIRVLTDGREGPQDRAVRLYTNQPDRRVAELRVAADVRLGLVVAGAGGGTISFGVHAAGRPAKYVLRLRCPKSDPPWQVTGVESLAPVEERTAFRWEAKEVEPNDPEFRHLDLWIHHPGRAALGPVYERISVKTTHPERAEFVVDSQMNVVPKYYASPMRVALGPVREASVAARTVYLMAGEAGTPFEVKGVRVDGEGFLAGEPRRVPEGWAVDVRYDGMARGAGRLRAELVFDVDDAEAPEVRVTLSADVQGS